MLSIVRYRPQEETLSRVFNSRCVRDGSSPTLKFVMKEGIDTWRWEPELKMTRPKLLAAVPRSKTLFSLSLTVKTGKLGCLSQPIFFLFYDNTDNGFTYQGTQLCNISGYSTCKFILFVVISKVILSKISYTYSLL